MEDRCLWNTRTSSSRWACSYDIQAWVVGKQEARMESQTKAQPRTGFGTLTKEKMGVIFD
jgi:hypothetical protein